MNSVESLELNYKKNINKEVITMTIGKTKSYNTREFHKILIDNGFELVRQQGSHYIFKRGNQSITMNRDINYMVVRRLVKEYNLNLR